MLKIKSKLNYRRGLSTKCCAGCDHFVKEHPIVGIGGENLGTSSRCKVIGLMPGRMCRVLQSSVCDRHSGKERLRGLLGDRAYEQFVVSSHETA